MYPKKQHNPTDEERYQDLAGESGERGGARVVEGSRRFWKRSARRSSTSSSSTRSSPISTATAGYFARSTSAIARAICWTPKITWSRPTTRTNFRRPCICSDIHLEKGMHCTDCHFAQDSHGNGNLYGETRNAVEIDCVDCHGTISQKATLQTSAAAAPQGGTDLALLRTPWRTAAVLLAGRQAVSAFDGRSKTARLGKWCRWSTPSRRAIRTTAKNRGWRRLC